MSKLVPIFKLTTCINCNGKAVSFQLRHLKTYLRNSTGQNRLNGLALSNKHRVNMNMKIYDIIDELTKKSKRKMTISLLIRLC